MSECVCVCVCGIPRYFRFHIPSTILFISPTRFISLITILPACSAHTAYGPPGNRATYLLYMPADSREYSAIWDISSAQRAQYYIQCVGCRRLMTSEMAVRFVRVDPQQQLHIHTIDLSCRFGIRPTNRYHAILFSLLQPSLSSQHAALLRLLHESASWAFERASSID